MKKTLYSMMLDDEVVRQIDLLAHKNGTTRSGMVNQILAQHVDMITPERRVNDIFNLIAGIMDTGCELIPSVLPGAMTMSLKSSLSYRYRPSLKYEVEFFRSGGFLGRLNIKIRTQSDALMEELTRFFTAFCQVEEKCQGRQMDYTVYNLKFTRTLYAPRRDCTADELAQVISDYIKMLDTLLKSYLAGELRTGDMEYEYLKWLGKSDIMI